MTKFVEIRSKTILNRYKYRDNWFWNRYGVNPYRGCQFACNYCDAITEKYLMHEHYQDFSRIIYVKKDAPTLLRNELGKTKRDVVALGGVTDAYQPAERKYKITRRILEVLRDNAFPVHIITKSDLVLRDVDILREISRNSWCTISFTIITFEKEMLSLLEPFAPPPEKRLEAMRQIDEAGVQAGVDFTPIVPLILDSDVNMRDVVGRASNAGARYVLPGAGMTLRSNQRIRFFTLLERNFPGLVERYKKLYGTSKEPSREYLVEVNRRALELCKMLHVRSYIPPPTIERPLKENFEVANVLLLIAYFQEKREGNPYVAWAYHKAAENIEDLGESIKEIHRKKRLMSIQGVGERLAGIISDFLDTGECERLERLMTG